MKKVIFKRLIWSLTVIIISSILLISFISMRNQFTPYELLLPIVYAPIFALIIVYQIVYNIFFFVSLLENKEQIKNLKDVKVLFPTWQKIVIKISRIVIPVIFIVMLLWFGFSFMISSSYEKGVEKYLLLNALLNCEISDFDIDTETYSDFASLFPMISYSKDETYTYQNGDESKQIHVSALILESLPNSVINSCYESYLNTSTKTVYKLPENPDVLTNDKTDIPFEREDIMGYYTVNKLIGANETYALNSTEIAVKTDGACVIINISFSNAEDFSQLDIDSAISVVCDLLNAVRSHSLYSLDKAYYEFYDEYREHRGRFYVLTRR